MLAPPPGGWVYRLCHHDQRPHGSDTHRGALAGELVLTKQGVGGELVHTFAFFPVSRLTLPFLYYKTRPQGTQAYGLLFIQ